MYRALRDARYTVTSKSTLHCFTAIESALGEQQLLHALRQIDRAWRSSPEHAASLAAIYGRLLTLDSRDYDAALRLLRRCMLDADAAALIAYGQHRLGRVEEAHQTLRQALIDFCLIPDGLLAHVATAVLTDPVMTEPGWIARGADLQCIGELKLGEATQALTIRLDTGAEFVQPIKFGAGDGSRFRFPLPALPPDARLDIASHGRPLLGSGFRATPDFGLDGRSTEAGGRAEGWVRIAWCANESVKLRVQDELGSRTEITARGIGPMGRGQRFRVDLNRAQLRGRRIQISARLPNREWRLLPDMPLLLPRAVRIRSGKQLGGSRSTAIAARRRPQPLASTLVDVIIPVYRGRAEALACIDAVLKTTAAHARVVVVDDATEDSELASALDGLAAAGSITLLRNAVNLGFVASVNRALDWDPTNDVVLLNADTVVFGDWLTRLCAAAYAAPNIGTVTPLTNSGSIASYPGPGPAAMGVREAAALHTLAADAHAAIAHDIPVGVGFCLYVRRDCLTQVGAFDAAVFGPGYGEETDFCLRARHYGWTHRLAADVFVYHAGGVSFGPQRDALLARSQRLLNLRHLGYDRLVDGFIAKDPLRPLRRTLDERRLRAFAGRFVLIVTLSLPGGVDRYIAERVHALRERGLHPLILKPLTSNDARRCVLSTDALDVPNLDYDIPSNLAALTALLRALPLEAVEIQHFLHLDARVIDAVCSLGPYDVVVHDYAWLCPRVTLIDHTERYCGEPDLKACNACVKRNGTNLGESISVAALRARSTRWLSGARRVAAPSADAARRIKRYFDRDVEVIPHTAATSPRAPAPRPHVGAMRVVLVGALAEHKGYNILLECARHAQARHLPVEFVVIGFTENDAPLLKTGKVFITGRYVEGEAKHLLAREMPDLVFMASVWPETWSYTLDEALGAGLPVMAFDLGAIAERLRSLGTGVLLPIDAGVQRINDEMMKLAAQYGAKLPRETGITERSKKMKTTKKPVTTSTQPDALSASVQILPLTAGLYLFSVTSAGASNQTGELQIPAMHVGLGPGVSSRQVEFVTGPSTDGAWLFAKEDCLVTKVHGAGAALVLTSVRGRGGETLSIKVERLDHRGDAPPASSAAPRPAEKPAPPSLAHAGHNGQARRPAKSDDPAHAATNLAALDPTLPLRVEIGAHIRTRGDMAFSDVPWAGRIATGLWIESFLVRPLEHFAAGDIEYKGLTGSGFETPWLSDAIMCGTKGMAVPLVGFAIRLKSRQHATTFDCEYSGYFKSGVTVGPLKNGTPCRSTVANDPLEGIQVNLRRRMVEKSSGAKSRTPPPAVDPKPTRPAGPSFGRYREANGHAPAVAPRSGNRIAKAPKNKAGKPVGNLNGKVPAPRSAKRSAARRA